MSQFLSSNELFINVKNPPKWNPKKHYFDQSIDVLDFYAEEKRKITEGITIGGYFIHPWLYWHINFFKSPIPQKDGTEPIMNPPLDDNFLYLIENYIEAEQTNKGLVLFGTRGFAKSLSMSSLITWLNSVKQNGVTSVVGGNDGDLKAMSRLLKVGFNNVHPSMAIPQLIQDWESQVELGIKEKDGFRLPHSHLSITNANAGTSNASEKGAGLSPIGFIMDEIGKFQCIKVLESALPSFRTQYGLKLVPVLSGTGGNNELSSDARKILYNPEAFDLLPMNWDRLERFSDPESVTWERSKRSKFGTFVPGQMSYRLTTPRVTKTLADVLHLKDKDLAKIKVQTVDWPKATELIKSQIAAFKDEEHRDKHRMYYPLEVDDIFITTSTNPFPTSIIDKRIRELEDQGLIGRGVTIYNSTQGYRSEFSGKKRAEVSHGGGEADAPIVLFDEMPIETPPKHLFVSGLDDYKLDQSNTDSLGAFYVIKRRNLEPNSPAERIIASYVARPFRHADFHVTCETMLDCWGAICNMEAVDTMFLQHLNFKHKAEQSLCSALSFSNSINNGNHKAATKFGTYPTAGNKAYMFNLVVDYTKEEHVMGIDEEGNQIIKHGVDFIDDIDLLKEMMTWKKGGNFDRITAFMHALAYARELDKKDIRPKESLKNMVQQQVNRIKPKLAVFGNRRPNAF